MSVSRHEHFDDKNYLPLENDQKKNIYIIHMPTHHQQRKKNSVFKTAIRKT